MNRRNFIQMAGKSLGSITLVGGWVGFSCSGSLYESYRIDAGKCIGCGICSDECRYQAISLPIKSEYRIDVENCRECGVCVDHCPEGAIHVAAIEYAINNDQCTDCGDCQKVCDPDAIIISWADYGILDDKCVGCGDCIGICETNAINYIREYYTVNTQLCGQGCGHGCVSVCPEQAIKSSGRNTVIDLAKCTRCGLCLSACPRDAILPALVALQTDLCTQCGKCFPICSYDAIDKKYQNSDLRTSIDKSKCNRCGNCLPICPSQAIIKIDPVVYFSPYIEPAICTHCGKCFKGEVCIYEGALIRTLYQAQILHKECVKCGDCIDLCPEKAIDS